MARIIHRGEVYSEVSLSFFHESEVQAQIRSRAEVLFPGYLYAEFTPTIKSDDDSAKPDFVLIEKQYRRWYVGETEMFRHDLYRHVLRQVRVFRSGYYSEAQAKLVRRQQSNVDTIRLKLLMETVKPGVFVIADRLDEEWKSVLRGEGATVGLFQIFRREQSADLVFRVNGEMPEIPDSLLSTCHRDRSLPRLLRVETPSSIPVEPQSKISIDFEGIHSDWVFQVAEDKAWLNPLDPHDLQKDCVYLLRSLPDGTLRLEQKRCN